MRSCSASLFAIIALAGCTTTLALHETTPVAVSAARPALPPPPPPEPPPRVQVEATRIRVDEKIHFEFDRADIRPDSDDLLREIATVITNNPQITRIRVEGHTDRQGSAAYNLRLSRRRAEAVVARLVENGVAGDRLVAEGFGFSRPITEDETEEGHAQNRRVEFNIVDQTAPAEGQPAPGEGAPAPAEGAPAPPAEATEGDAP